MKSCKTCGHCWQPNKYTQHYVCPAVDRGDLTADALWTKLQTGGMPIMCEEWCSKDEIGDTK